MAALNERGPDAGENVEPSEMQTPAGVREDRSTAVPRPSLRSAIDAMCKSCIYDPLSGLGTWREQVSKCSCRLCPLYDVRPAPRYRAAIGGVDADGTSVTASPTGTAASESGREAP